MDPFIFFIIFLIIWNGVGFILKKLIPKPIQCESELIWHYDQDPNAYIPDLNKDFDARLDACIMRIKMLLPLFHLQTQRKTVLNLLDQQRYRVMWILNDLEKTMKIKCIFMSLLLITDKTKNLLLMFPPIGATTEGVVIDLSHKNILYKIDVEGNIEIMP
ncbi:MAG: hypothetical protein HZA36_01975 [Parcubacteria group bacterium]|nr:hypothetical protein [Parcubacteria group bacterium]